MRKYLLFLLLIGVVSCSKTIDVKPKVGVLYGKVVEESSGASMYNVAITISPLGSSTVTGADGRYEFVDLECQKYNVTAYKSGYQSDSKVVTVLSEQSVACDFIMRAGSSSLVANPKTLDFGATKTQMVFDISNSSTVSTDYTISVPSGSWCSVSPTRGTLQAANGTQGITVTVNRDYIVADRRENIIVTADNGGSASIEINVDYQDGGDSGSGDGDDGDGEQPTTPTVDVINGLWAYYTFDNEDMSDAWENEMHGRIENTPTFLTSTPSGVGKALKLGLNNHNELVKARVPYNPFANKTEYSFCFWVKDPTQGLMMNAYGSDTNSNYDNFPTIHIYDSKIYSGFSYGSMDDYFNYNVTNTIQDGGWHHIAVSVKDEEQILYVDGVRVSTQQRRVDKGYSSEIHFGGELRYYDGADMKIDNIRLYTRTISAMDAISIYSSEN